MQNNHCSSLLMTYKKVGIILFCKIILLFPTFFGGCDKVMMCGRRLFLTMNSGPQQDKEALTAGDTGSTDSVVKLESERSGDIFKSRKERLLRGWAVTPGKSIKDWVEGCSLSL